MTDSREPVNNNTMVKICGLTRESDVDFVGEAGAHFAGFILYDCSARHVSIARARALAERLPDHVVPVLVLVDADDLDVTAIHDHFTATELHFVIQFHGHESPERCTEIANRLQGPHWRAAGVPAHASVNDPAGRSMTDLLIKYAQPHVNSEALLLDSEVAAAATTSANGDVVFGGTGQRFDWDLVNWSLLKQSAASRLVLSGGLTAANVIDGITQARPWAVDVSSGVEVALPNGQLQRGIKDREKITQFIAAVHRADAQSDRN